MWKVFIIILSYSWFPHLINHNTLLKIKPPSVNELVRINFTFTNYSSNTLLWTGCINQMEHIIYWLTLGWEFLCLHFFIVCCCRDQTNTWCVKMLIFRSTGVCRYLQLLNRASCFLSDSSLNQSSLEQLLAEKQIKANPKKMNHAIIKGAFTSQDPRLWSENTPPESGPFDWCVNTSASKQGSVLLCCVLCLLLLLCVYWRMANQLGEYSYVHKCTRVWNDMWSREGRGSNMLQ